MSARATVLCLALLATAAHAADSTEMLDGDYACSYGGEDAWNGLNLFSSGDLFPDGKFGWREFEGAGASGEAFCSGQLEVMRGLLPNDGCTISDAETTAYEDGVVAHRFYFVCDGPRRRLVRIATGLYAEFLTAAP